MEVKDRNSRLGLYPPEPLMPGWGITINVIGSGELLSVSEQRSDIMGTDPSSYFNFLNKMILNVFYKEFKIDTYFSLCYTDR